VKNGAMEYLEYCEIALLVLLHSRQERTLFL
jgi:hypothetical protein